jgi:F0F1-type ATP synthase assembly protein I
MSSRPPKLTADEIRKAQGETDLFQILLTLLVSMLSIGVAIVIVLYGDTILHTVPLGLFAFAGGCGITRSVLKLRKSNRN